MIHIFEKKEILYISQTRSVSRDWVNEISLHSRKFIEQSLSKIPSTPDKSLFSSVDPPSRRGVESKNRRNRNGTTVFRRFIESKRSHFACMAEGNAALRAFACFSPVTLSENPFARPFSRSTRFVPRFHATPLLSRFFLSFFFFTRISRRGGRTTTPFFVRWIGSRLLFSKILARKHVFFPSSC